MEFSELIYKRKSKRWFLEREVSRQDLETILTQASQAPSTLNHQPWQVCLIGRDKMGQIAQILEDAQQKGNMERPFNLLDSWPEPHQQIILKTRARSKRVFPDDAYSRWFYNAPIGIYIHIHEQLNEWSVLDVGSFAQSLMLAAENLGIQSVPQAKTTSCYKEIGKLLGLPPERKIVLGVNLGYTDPAHPNNQIITEREALENWTSWHL